MENLNNDFSGSSVSGSDIQSGLQHVSIENMVMEVIQKTDIPQEKQLHLKCSATGREALFCNKKQMCNVLTLFIRSAVKQGSIVRIEIDGSEKERTVVIRNNGAFTVQENSGRESVDTGYSLLQDDYGVYQTETVIAVATGIIGTQDVKIRSEPDRGLGGSIQISIKT